MLKVKAIIGLGINLGEMPTEWQDGLRNCLLSLNGATVHFGSESRGQIAIQNIDFEELKLEK